MSKWLFRRSSSESVKARTEQARARPKRPRPRSTQEKDFEDVEIAEFEIELPQAYEDGASSTSAEQGVLDDVIKEAHDKETKLLQKIHTQEQKLRQHEHDLRSKDDKVLALRVEIADLKCKIDEFPGHLQSSNTRHEDSTEDVDEHSEKATNKSSTQPQPQSMPSLSSRRPRSFDPLGAELAAATELSRKDAEIRRLKEEISNLKEAPLKKDSTDSYKDEVLHKELDEMKKENARLRKQVEAIVVLQDQVDEFRDDAYKAKQLQEHSQLQSKHVMELKQELGATQMAYDELKEYTQSLQGMVEDLEHTVDSLRGSLQRANASGGTDQSYWEESLREKMAEIEDYKIKLTTAERMESDELKKLDDQLLELRGENASLERNVQSMAEECKEAHKELKELHTQLEVTRTEATIYRVDYATERRDREKAHATMEKLKEQFATDLVLLTEQNRLELEAYQQGNLKEARALAQERETAQCQSEVQAKNVQVRQYKKQVDSLTSQLAELERHNTDLIQEMSRVRDEVVRVKKSKPRKGEKAAPLSEKLSELEFLYDNSCREMEVMKDTKRALSVLNVELTNGNQKLTAEIQKLMDENQKLERENQQLRKASMTLLQVDPPVRARLASEGTPESLEFDSKEMSEIIETEMKNEDELQTIFKQWTTAYQERRSQSQESMRLLQISVEASQSNFARLTQQLAELQQAKAIEVGRLEDDLRKWKIMHGELREAHLVAEADLAEKGEEVDQLRSSTQELTDEVQLWMQEASTCQLKYEGEQRDREAQMKSFDVMQSALKLELETERAEVYHLNKLLRDLEQSCEREKEKLEFFEKEFDSTVVDIKDQLSLLKSTAQTQPMESENRELARYRIMSYQPLSGDTFFGAGSYGSVHRVRVNNIPCIAKRILDILVGREREEAVSDKQKQAIQLKFQQECFLLSRMRHPNIVQFMGVHYPDQNPLDLTLIMEFLPMDLEKCLQKYPNLPLPIKLSILLGVSYGLLHLHNASIIHRDLSAANVLLTPDMRAKISDLGVSKILQLHPRQMTKQSALPGALGYMPPEALWEEPVYATKLDIFSFGVLALYVGVQVYPEFYDLKKDEPRDSEQIRKRRKWIQMLPEKGCSCLQRVVVQCLQDEAAHRPTTERLNIMLKQLSQDHPRQCTDIVHLEEELTRMHMKFRGGTFRFFPHV